MRSRTTVSVAMLVVDAVLLGVFYHYILRLVRPFDVLAAGAAVLGVVTAMVVKWNSVRALALVVASLGGTLFALEMGQKYFNILGRVEVANDGGDGGKYTWDMGDSATYLAAKERARRDGIHPEALADHFVGDIMTATYAGQFRTIKQERKNAFEVYECLKGLNINQGPLGFELTPDNVARAQVFDRESRRVTDSLYTIDAAGLRKTRAAANAAEAYVFLGCSFTFGAYLSDDETLAYFFSRAHGFEKKVINMGVPGYGPGNVLRDLELDWRLGRTGTDPKTIKGVFYGLINDHANRAAGIAFAPSPYYVLRDGKPVFKEIRHQGFQVDSADRLQRLVDRSRIISALRDRIYYKIHSSYPDYKWQLTVAMLAEMDRICRERYGVPMTVVYWEEDSNIVALLKEKGLETILVREAFEEGANWRQMAIKYFVFDKHPSAYANKRLGEYLYRKTVGR